MLEERRATGGISLRKFYARRSLRIFPLYYAVLAAYVVLMNLGMRGTAEARGFFSHLPYFLAYLSNWYPGPAVPVFGFAWSLAAEEQFYAVWPWMEKWLSPVRACLLMAILLAVIIAVPALRPIPTAICWGVLFAHFHFGREWRFSGSRWASLAALVFSFVAIATDVHFAVKGFSLALLVFTCSIREDHVLRPVLAWRPLAYIGMISYGMYMLHILVYRVLLQGIRTLQWPLEHQGLPIFVLTTAGSIAAAALSYRYFERPFLRWKEKFR